MQEKLAQLTKKYDGLKSRTQTLEKEKQESKSKFQLLVDKSKNDDALIDALQRQLAIWKTKVQEVKRARTAESVSSQLPAAQQKEELARLRSMVAEYKRQQGTPLSQSMALSSGMPVPSEASQYRTMVAEKERLQEVVKALQSQLEEKERQLRQLKQQQPPMTPSMLAALSDDAAAMISRIPRKPGMPAFGRGTSRNTNLTGPGSSSSLSPQSQNQSGGGAMHDAEVEALRRTFRESLRAKEDQIAALSNRLHDLETSQQQLSNHHTGGARAEDGDDDDEDLAQEVQDLQVENQFLRQEFDKLKTRYETLVRNTKSSVNGHNNKAK